MSEDFPTQPATTSRRWRAWIAIALAALGGVAAGWLLTRGPGPPGAPDDVTAEPFRCPSPCPRLDPSITVRWSAPSDGGEPTSYRVERDGVALVSTAAETAAMTSFIDREVTFGQRYDYRVVAVGSAGPSQPSATITVRLPRPPTATAQLAGRYIVRLTVRRARALSSALGIERPKPGDTATDRWTFEPVCSTPSSTCPAQWEGLDGLLVPTGPWWSGSVAGPEADCGGGIEVAAPTTFDLEALAGVGDGDTWVVRSFEGSVSISFHCPGFLTSSGSVDVRGTRR